MRIQYTFLPFALVLSPLFASEPGQPLDASDWVLAIPGLVASEFLPPHIGRCNDDNLTEGDSDVCMWEGGASIDSEGAIFVLDRNEVLTGVYCGNDQIRKQVLYRLNRANGTRQLLASLTDRCVAPGLVDRWDFMQSNWEARAGVGPDARFNFDAPNGGLYFRMRSNCAGCPLSESRDRVIRIVGFATTFDVLQTFAPPASLGFRVPHMPEGMTGADHFDSYWGNLTKPLDFTQAHALQCDYPTAAPHVGDYLTVADTVPTPAPGQGIYYVTAATYQGVKRYGRKTTAGLLSGRDPALLPVCGP